MNLLSARARTFATLSALSALFAPLQAQTATPGLGSLAGCWQGGSGTRVIEEQWLKARGGVMLGTARTTSGDTMRNYEFTELRLAGDSVTYIAMPVGQQRTEFRGRMTGPHGFVVENLANDFPTHVGYELVTRDSLSAWIEGPAGAEKRRIPYAYRRVACEES
jgi:hypothetical protein